MTNMVEDVSKLLNKLESKVLILNVRDFVLCKYDNVIAKEWDCE